MCIKSISKKYIDKVIILCYCIAKQNKVYFQDGAKGARQKRRRSLLYFFISKTLTI